MSTLTTPQYVDIAPFMAFLPKRLLIRYLIYKDTAYGENFEHVAVRVLYVSASPGAAFEVISLEDSETISTYATAPKKPLWLHANWGSEAIAENCIKCLLLNWKSAAEAGHQAQRLWLEPEEFVGVLRVGDRFQKVDATAPMFMMLHGIMAARLAEHGERLQRMKGLERNLNLLADAVERMGSRFSAFAARNHHALMDKEVPLLLK